MQYQELAKDGQSKSARRLGSIQSRIELTSIPARNPGPENG